ncbi:MAG: hypothetical protein RLZZ15_2920 [Verrucomicrobiota bacterium]|jgi:hypothetical protein
MSFFKKNPFFGTALTVCGALAVGEGWLIYERWTASRAAVVKLEKRKAELMGMANLVPAPKKDIAAAIEADLARGEKALTTMQSELTGRGPTADRLATAKPPAARTDAYFDLATFVEKTRELAKKQEVLVQPAAARFGFALYTNVGPEVDRIPAVFQQRLIAQYLIESLLEARPRALVGVQRERTLTKAEREARAAALATAAANAIPGTPVDPNAPDLPGSADPESPDFFAIDTRASARVAGYIETVPFRISFIGQTSSLRTFLNKLASFELPVLVREVEVEPTVLDENAVVADDNAAPVVAEAPVKPAKPLVPVAAPAKGAPKVVAVPIVAKPLSKYTVTVEYVALLAAAPPAAADAPPTPTPPAKPTE